MKQTNKLNNVIQKLVNVRNIGIIAHIDAGKTTTSERILYLGKKIHSMGEVHSGDTTMDYMDLERKRGITIQSAVTRINIECDKNNPNLSNKVDINLIDTPGHNDFKYEVYRCLTILDGGVLVFDGVAGVESQSISAFNTANEFNVSLIAFINKLDRIGASYRYAFNSIKNKLTDEIIPINIPIFRDDQFLGIVDLIRKNFYIWKNNDIAYETINFKNNINEVFNKDEINLINEFTNMLFEKLSELDDVIAEKCINDEIDNIDLSYLLKTIRKLTINKSIIPVFCGSAFKNKGVQQLIEGVRDFLPNPNEKQTIKYKEAESYDSVQKNPDNYKDQIMKNDNPDTCCFIFKTTYEPFLGLVAYIKVCSGELKLGDRLYLTRTNKLEKVSKIFRINANEKEYIDVAYVGDIVGICIKNAKSGDTLSQKNNVFIAQIKKLVPTISVSIIPEKNDKKFLQTLKILADEDPSLVVGFDPENGECIISGPGELFLDIKVTILRNQYKIPVKVGEPKINYRETITKEIIYESKHVKQSGGRGQFAIIKARISPCKEDFIFEDKTVGGCIKKEFIPVIKESAIKFLKEGPLTRSQVIGVKLTILDGKFHEVDSNAESFVEATKTLIYKGLVEAEMIVLEPIMKLEVVVPIEHFNPVRAFVASVSNIKDIKDEVRGNTLYKHLLSFASVDKLFKFQTQLSSLTSGMGTFTQTFFQYEHKKDFKKIT